MNVLISGSSGLIGSALASFLAAGGHSVGRLVRRAGPSGGAEVFWDPQAGLLDPARLEGFDGVVHLAGDSIAEGRWTEQKKRRLLDSRVKGTRLLSEALSRTQRPPRVMVCASAVGYYGNRGAELLREDSPPGSLFLSRLCREWEEAAEPARRKGIRVVHPRFGVVLSALGGALAKMLFPFRMGLGGRIGSGEQYMSWIAIDDVLGVVLHALTTESLRGPTNAVTPSPVTNSEFTRTLGRVLGRPTVFPMPAFAAHLAFGEMADELLLASARVDPAKLRDSGYRFQYPDLEPALRHLLGGARA